MLGCFVTSGGSELPVPGGIQAKAGIKLGGDSQRKASVRGVELMPLTIFSNIKILLKFSAR